MKNILIIGAGRSASSLIKYLLENAAENNWNITVGDVSLELVQQKVKGFPSARAIAFDIQNESQRREEIRRADLVISMLPAFMHMNVAKDCVEFGKHLATASYVSKEMAELNEEAKQKGVILMNEIGLDPGIDHASAMKVIDHFRSEGYSVQAFRSYCGGLVAPESNDNPWGYKFSWNPRNVILAGQGTAQYIENGHYKYIPYNRLFIQTEMVEVDGLGTFEAYANRDSLSYRKSYSIEGIPTMLRGTLRSKGYCKAWNVFVKLGLTDDTYRIEASSEMTWKQLVEAYLPAGSGSLQQRLVEFMGSEMDATTLKLVEWLEIFSDKKIRLSNASPAQILQDLLEEKWKLKESDKDMIVMQHEFEFQHKSSDLQKKVISSLVVKGEDQTYTAMAKTVGLPLAITAKLILQNKLHVNGVVIPVIPEIYEPVLKELESLGIRFVEKEI